MFSRKLSLSRPSFLSGHKQPENGHDTVRGAQPRPARRILSSVKVMSKGRSRHIQPGQSFLNIADEEPPTPTPVPASTSLPPANTNGTRKINPFSHFEKLSTIPSCSDLNKDLPEPPLPSPSAISSVSNSSFPYHDYAPPAGPLLTPHDGRRLARPDSSILPRPVADPACFLAEPEDSDHFYPPEQDYDLRRMNAVHERVKRWVEDDNSPSSSDEDAPFHVAAWANVRADEDDDGIVLSPAFQSPTWEYPSRGNVEAHAVHREDGWQEQPKTRQYHQSVHPVLEFSSIAALMETRPPSMVPQRPRQKPHSHAYQHATRTSVPISIGQQSWYLGSPPDTAMTSGAMMQKMLIELGAPVSPSSPDQPMRVPVRLESPNSSEARNSVDIIEVWDRASPPPSPAPSVTQSQTEDTPTRTEEVPISTDPTTPISTLKLSPSCVMTPPPVEPTHLLTPPSSEVNHQIASPPRDGTPKFALGQVPKKTNAKTKSLPVPEKQSTPLSQKHVSAPARIDTTPFLRRTPRPSAPATVSSPAESPTTTMPKTTPLICSTDGGEDRLSPQVTSPARSTSASSPVTITVPPTPRTPRLPTDEHEGECGGQVSTGSAFGLGRSESESEPQSGSAPAMVTIHKSDIVADRDQRSSTAATRSRCGSPPKEEVVEVGSTTSVAQRAVLFTSTTTTTASAPAQANPLNPSLSDPLQMSSFSSSSGGWLRRELQAQDLDRVPETPLSTLQFARDDSEMRSSLTSELTPRPHPRVVTVVAVPRRMSSSAETGTESGTAPPAIISSSERGQQAQDQHPISRRIMTTIAESPVDTTPPASSPSASLTPSPSPLTPSPSPLTPSPSPLTPSTSPFTPAGNYVSPRYGGPHPQKSLPNPPSVTLPQVIREPSLQTMATSAADDATFPSYLLPSGPSPVRHQPRRQYREYASYDASVVPSSTDLDVDGLVDEIRAMSARCLIGIAGTLSFFNTCEVLADRRVIIELCLATRDSVRTVMRMLEAGPNTSDVLADASSQWMEGYREKLSSLRNNLTRMAHLVESLVRKPPRLDRVQEVMSKLTAFTNKFLNLTDKLESSYEKLQAYRDHCKLVAAHRSAQATSRDDYAARDAYRALYGEKKNKKKTNQTLTQTRSGFTRSS